MWEFSIENVRQARKSFVLVCAKLSVRSFVLTSCENPKRENAKQNINIQISKKFNWETVNERSSAAVAFQVSIAKAEKLKIVPSFIQKRNN